MNRQNFITARNKYNKIKRLSKLKYKQKIGREVSDMAKKKPKDFWKSIKNTFKKKSTTSDKLTAADLFDHFKSVIGNEQDSTEDHDFSLNNENLQNEYLDSKISENEIKCAVFSQKNNKSTGTGQLCADLFKAAYDIISQFLLVLFNRLLSNSEYPRLCSNF